MRGALVLLIGLVFLVGCTRPALGSADAAPVPEERLIPALPSPFAPPPTPSAAHRPIALAVQDLAQRVAVLPEEISVDSVRQVTWSDSSLGCPQPGFVYAQVTVPGYLIVLVAAGTSHAYHTDTIGRIVYCQDGLVADPVVTPPRPGEIKDDQPWMPVY